MPVNVLVVQDEAPIASFIKRGLEAEGFVVRTASDGAEGLRLMRSSQFDLIILDLLLPSVSGEEVLARVRARLRTADQAESTVISHGAVTLDLHAREVRIDGRSVELTAREFALLETFMRHRGEVLSQPQLLDQVWVYDHEPSSNVVEVYVAYLRKKLRPDVVETVRGMGYRFRG